MVSNFTLNSLSVNVSSGKILSFCRFVEHKCTTGMKHAAQTPGKVKVSTGREQSLLSAFHLLLTDECHYRV